MTHAEREVLRKSAYGEPSKLEARQRLWSYADRVRTSGRISWAWTLRGDETVVDVGCGNGNDLRALVAERHRGHLVGVDFSAGMLADIPESVARRVVGDATALPLSTDSADVICALHMLYHVDDRPAALREAKRVLRPGGVFLASTNSEAAAKELTEPWSEAMEAAGGPPLRRVSHAAFSLENGEALLRTVFASVAVKTTEVTARVPTPDVIRAYVASTDDLYRPMLPDEQAWERVLDGITAHAAAVIAKHGTFAVTQRAGVFICHP